MISLTVRNIPDDIMDKIRTLSSVERRSINNEILVLLEKALAGNMKETVNAGKIISSDLQAEAWKKLSGQWEDKRSTKAIIKDIINHRSMGREVDL